MAARETSGVAIFIDQELVHQLQKKLHRRCSNNQAEQYAVRKALEQLELLQQLQDVRKSAAIHTDSRITLDSLRNFNNHHHLKEQIRKQIRKLETLNWTIHFAWVKAHVGLTGNELVDHLAKQVASNNELPVSFDRIPVSDIMRELQEESVVKWEKRLRVNIPLNGKVTTFLTGHGKTSAAEGQPVVYVWSTGTDRRLPPFRVPKMDKERLAFQREMLRKTGKWTFTKRKLMQEHAHSFINYVFNTVRRNYTQPMKKVIPMMGDITQPGLGLSPKDRDRLCREVSIVFHAAATIKFNENLKVALQTNVMGTQEIVYLCKEMPQIVALVYVSTAYSNCSLKEIDEKVYPPPHDPRRLTECVNWMSETDFQSIEPT
ncbi:hypothetical protein ANN_11865 [Periplaneta americana]|uniref:Fatty acyl-CoA reductase n=1 Tax=Periplaneta americana TaxID=6978 RepID=A0ABQ8T6A0_PERAM|nr:hypothetical protein ANN_11865 [Periplaneta americana]